MKKVIVTIVSLMLLGIEITSAQSPNVQVSPKKHILNIGQTLQASPNKKGKFGYVDTNGKYYIKPVFDEVTDFKKIFTDDWSYLASVKHGGKWRLIKDNGEYFPNPNVEFDTKPIFLGDRYVLCEYNDKFYKHWLISWGNPVCYDEKIIFEDKTVYLQNKENNKEGLIIKSNGRIQNLNDCCLNAIDDCHIINSGGFVLVDKNFNEITERYDYMQGNGQTVMAMNRDGEGIVYRNGIIYSFKLEAPKIDCTLHVQYIIGREKLLTMITTPEQNNNDDNNIKTVTTLKRVGVNLFEVHKEGKYGLIDISGNLSIPIIHDHSIFDSFGRYKTNTDDVIVMNNTMYSISDYENYIYKNIEKNSRYDIGAQAYLADSLLTVDEKIHYKEVTDNAEAWKIEVSSKDDELFAELSPDEYIETKQIPGEFKKHIENAIQQVNKRILARERNMASDLLTSSFELEDFPRWDEVRKDGNIYTYYVFSYKGFIYRECQVLNRLELVISHSKTYQDNIRSSATYIDDLAAFTGDNDEPDHKDLRLVMRCPFGENRTFLVYDYDNSYIKKSSYSYMDVVDVVPNPITGIPELVYGRKNLYDRVERSIRYIAIINSRGIERKFSIPSTFDRFLCKGNDIYLFGGPNVLCVNRDGNLCLQYNGAQGTQIVDVGRTIDGRYVLVGITHMHGYIGSDNLYLVILDENGKEVYHTYEASRGTSIKNLTLSDKTDEFIIRSESNSVRLFTVNKDNTITLQ